MDHRHEKSNHLIIISLIINDEELIKISNIYIFEKDCHLVDWQIIL